MKAIQNIKKYSVGFLIGIMSVSTIVYGASEGSIGELFNFGNLDGQTGVWRLDGVNIQNGTVGNAELGTNSVTTAKITDGNVTLAKLAGNSVDSSKIVDLSVGTTDLANSAVTTAKITDGNVTLAKLASDSVDTSKLLNGNVTLAKLAGNSVDSSKIVDLSVGTADLANSAVTTVKIADSNVTQAKVSNGYVDLSSTQTISGTKTFSTLQASQFLYTSDRRFKENIQTISSPLQTVQSLRGVTWNWKKDGRADMGFIAQEVEEILPEMVHTDENGYKSVQYANMVGLLVEAVKEQQKQIDELNKKVMLLKSK